MQAAGQQGGSASPLDKAYVQRGKERIDILEPHRPMKLHGGDHLVTLSGGGAGVGAPQRRDPEVVAQDVRNELVSLDMAREVYRVIVDPKTFEVDQAATARLRKARQHRPRCAARATYVSFVTVQLRETGPCCPESLALPLPKRCSERE